MAQRPGKQAARKVAVRKAAAGKPAARKAGSAIRLSSPPGVAPAASYEHVAIAGDFAFVAGQIAKDASGNWVGIGDAGAQAKQVYANIGRILASIGATPRDVCKINAILVDRADRDAVTAARLAFFGDHRPPHTGIICGLGSPEVLIEVEVVVNLPRHRAKRR
jgi:2-iminobutanoate/2-iminopropanoate deaminase